MFVPFSIENNPVDTLEQWIAFVHSTPKSERGSLLHSLRRKNQGMPGYPNFSKDAEGATLLEWARKNNASYTLMQEIKQADRE